MRADLLASLRAWQKAAYQEYFRLPRRDFLLVATPGAGKTAFALTIAAELLARREVATVTVVTPTEHLKHQWSQAAHRVGIALDPAYRNSQGAASADYAGVVVTYAQVAAHPALHRQRTTNRRTLVIFDEIHHAGDALSWGEAAREAFEPARRRMGLTGTPFRSDANPIPFVTYTEEPDGGLRSRADYVYGYGPALEDGVVRPVIFLAYSGEMRWRSRAGDEITGTLGAPMTPDQLALRLADRAGPRRRVGGPGAGGRRPAADRGAPGHAGRGRPGHRRRPRGRARLRRLLRKITGTRPVVVLSDDPAASKKIGKFAAVRGPVDGGGPDGLRGRGHPAAGRRRLRHQRQHRAVLRPGGRPLRPRARRAARPPRCSCRRFRCCWATPPSWRPSAITCWPAGRRRRRGARAGRGAAAAGTRPTSSARRRSRRWRRRRTSTGRCTTAASSAPRPRRMTSSACPGLLEPEQVSPAAAQAQGRPGASPRTRPGGGRPGRTGPGAPASARRADAGRRGRPARRQPRDRRTRRGGGTAGSTRENLAALRKELNALVTAWHHRTGQPHARHPRRAAPGLRRPRGPAGHRHPDPRADRDAAPLGGDPPLTTFVKISPGTESRGPLRSN